MSSRPGSRTRNSAADAISIMPRRGQQEQRVSSYQSQQPVPHRNVSQRERHQRQVRREEDFEKQGVTVGRDRASESHARGIHGEGKAGVNGDSRRRDREAGGNSCARDSTCGNNTRSRPAPVRTTQETGRRAEYPPRSPRNSTAQMDRGKQHQLTGTGSTPSTDSGYRPMTTANATRGASVATSRTLRSSRSPLPSTSSGRPELAEGRYTGPQFADDHPVEQPQHVGRAPNATPQTAIAPIHGHTLNAPTMMRNSPTKELLSPRRARGRKTEEREERRVNRRDFEMFGPSVCATSRV